MSTRFRYSDLRPRKCSDLKTSPKVVLPLVVVTAASAVMVALVAVRPSPESNRPQLPVPPVEVVRTARGPVQLWVSAQGEVAPRTESDLVTEVAGRIVWVSPRSAAGGFFEAGDVLARIEARDYEVALERAGAALARALADEKLAAATLARQRSMRRSGAASEARLDEAEHAQATAEANVREARSALARAELDLERTRIVAPFVGRVRERHIGVGQFVTRGQPVARVFSVDYAEVRLPITDADLAHLELPLGFRETRPGPPAEDAEVAPDAPMFEGPEVLLSARFAGAERTWRGRLVRVEGALDPQSRMLHVVARVDDPYGRSEDPEQPPLEIGLFVEASIRGRRVDDVFELPRTALRRRDEVLVVDAEERLRVRRVEVVRTDRERAWVRAGLDADERVVVSPLEIATDGMRVRSIEAAPTAADRETVADASGDTAS